MNITHDHDTDHDERTFTARQEAILDGICHALAEGGLVEIHRDIAGTHVLTIGVTCWCHPFIFDPEIDWRTPAQIDEFLRENFNKGH